MASSNQDTCRHSSCKASRNHRLRACRLAGTGLDQAGRDFDSASALAYLLAYLLVVDVLHRLSRLFCLYSVSYTDGHKTASGRHQDGIKTVSGRLQDGFKTVSGRRDVSERSKSLLAKASNWYPLRTPFVGLYLFMAMRYDRR